MFSSYYKEKKFEIFDEMNDLYYSMLVEIPEELEELEEEVVSEEETISETEVVTTTNVTPVIDYSKYYVGNIYIPKIDLKKGFTEIDSRYNTVSRNVQVIRPSDYPDVEKGNFILAGHSGSSSVSFFKDLYKLGVADEVYITYNNVEYKYIIKNIYTDIKDGDVAVRRNRSKTTLTLITCTKGDKNTQTIYIAERV